MRIAVGMGVVLALCGGGCAELGQPLGDSEARAGTRYLVTLEDSADPAALLGFADASRAVVEQLLSTVGVAIVIAPAAEVPALLSVTGVRAVEPVLGVGGGLPVGSAVLAAAGTQVEPWGVTRVGGPQHGADAALWVLDTGVDAGNDDLVIDRERSFDMVAHFDPVEADADPSHGTAVAGVAAAIDNDHDVVGVAPGATVVDVRVLDSSGGGRTDVLVAALEYVAEHGEVDDVVNLSLASPGQSVAIEASVARVAARGLWIVIAAGNDGADAGEYTPAAVDRNRVFTVSAIGQDDCTADFSNYGAPIDIAAPGRDVLTLRVGGGTVVVDGTSFAAPHVAGLLLAAALATDGTVCGDADAAAEPIAHD